MLMCSYGSKWETFNVSAQDNRVRQLPQDHRVISYHTNQFQASLFRSLMTILIFCIKWLAEEAFSTHSHFSSVLQKQALLPSWKLCCWPLLSLLDCSALWLQSLFLFLFLFLTMPSAEHCGELVHWSGSYVVILCLSFLFNSMNVSKLSLYLF